MLTSAQDQHVQRIKSLTNLQSLHDRIEKTDDHLSDPDNPFIDNGQSISERFDTFEKELEEKTKYLLKIIKETAVYI